MHIFYNFRNRYAPLTWPLTSLLVENGCHIVLLVLAGVTKWIFSREFMHLWLKDADCSCNDFGTTIKIDRETNLIRIHGGCDCNITLPTTFRGSIFSYYYIPALLAVIIVSVHIFCPQLLSLNYLNSMKLFTDHTIVQLHLFYILIRMTFGFSDSRTWT